MAGANTGINFTITGKGIDSMLGAIHAMVDAGGKTQYISDNIDYGVSEASIYFREYAAKFNESTNGAINHMYEYGRGEGTVNLSRRLWEDYVTTEPSRTKRLYFDFKTAKAYTPKMTTKNTGIPQEYLKDQKRYIFWNKARVMELGLAVNVKPRPDNETQLLLFPLRGFSSGRSNDKKRGFVFTHGPTNPIPGAQVKGNFTSLWYQYYNGGEGERVFKSSITRAIMAAFEKEYLDALAAGTSISDLKDLPYRITSYAAKSEKRLMANASMLSTEARTRMAT